MTDVIYFTMITITTVGYGDIVPVSDQARLIDAFFVTPVRIFVWFIFLGTAYQLIIQRLIEEWRMTRLQTRPAGPRGPVRLRPQRLDRRVRVAAARVAARARSWSWTRDATRCSGPRTGASSACTAMLPARSCCRVAAVDRAHSVIVSVGRDDTTVLVVLTIREIARRVRIVACVGEQENVKLVRASGADVIVSPPRFGGYLMADAVESNATVDFVAEALTFHGGVSAARARSAAVRDRPRRARHCGFAGRRGPPRQAGGSAAGRITNS